MLSSRVRLGAKEVVKTSTTAPVISPLLVRSLYRRLYREVSKLDANPMAKTLFPLTTDLQAVVGTQRPLYVPGSMNYLEVLRRVFRDGSRAPNVKLAFDTLNRLRVHDENVKSQVPAVNKDREALISSLAAEAPKHMELFRAEAVPMKRESSPQYVPAPSSSSASSRLVLRDRSRVELEPGTVLLAHPLSSTHIDRRVMIITDRTPVMTSGVVLDLQFIFPISRGNPMFPELFWGHEVYDGGFNQINLTMPPTAQVVILHTLEPPTEREEAEMHHASGSVPSTAQDYVSSWLKWGSTTAGAAEVQRPNEAGAATPAKEGAKGKRGNKRLSPLERQHELLCQPIIKGTTLSNGEKEPTLYVSKVEALPYLARLAAGQPRSSLRVYWGNMRWMTSHIEAEVTNGHWFPVKVSPSFFRSYDLSPADNLKNSLRKRGSTDPAGEARFPTLDDLAASKRLREKRFGADISLPQVFPAEGAIRRRECLWDEILFALGGEYTSLVGGINPFMLSGHNRPAPQILAPLLPSSEPLSVAAAVAPATVAAGASSEAATAYSMDSDDDDEFLHILEDAGAALSANEGEGDDGPMASHEEDAAATSNTGEGQSSIDNDTQKRKKG